jgi:probable F420-dependent oxidoreductase
MPTTRKFRFGVQLHSAPSGEEWAAKARKAEDLGYSTLSMPDHFGEQLAPVPALMAAADATTSLRVGTLVFDNDYKHPLVLAKECATLDVLSSGRLELGIGAGWMRTDYEQSGIPYDPPGTRVDRFVEGLTVLKGCLGGDAFSFKGEHYAITDYNGLPKPVQRPHPPILIGGGGRRVLSIAAREADIVGIAPNARRGQVDAETARTATAAATEEKIAWVREAAGDRFDNIELNILIFVTMVTDDRASVFEQIAGGFGVSSEEAPDVPHALVGTVDEIVEDLESRRERYGISYITVQGGSFDALAPVVAKLAGT